MGKGGAGRRCATRPQASDVGNPLQPAVCVMPTAPAPYPARAGRGLCKCCARAMRGVGEGCARAVRGFARATQGFARVCFYRGR
jgi:hypothetical protein